MPQNISVPAQTLLDSWIFSACALCGENRRDLPVDIFNERLSHYLRVKPSRIADRL
jgi:hypothetical protein